MTAWVKATLDGQPVVARVYGRQYVAAYSLVTLRAWEIDLAAARMRMQTERDADGRPVPATQTESYLAERARYMAYNR